MPTIENTARQGDVMLVRVNGLPDGVREVARDQHGRFVLAEGELHGHAHAIREKNVCAWRMADSDEIDFVQVSGGGASLNHEYASGQKAEHEPIVMDEGVYRVVRQREYSPERIVRVVD